MRYRLQATGTECADGVTRPLHGSLGAIIKSDGPEAEHCVYNEIVAVKLAHLLDVPVATGVLIDWPKGLAFASIEVATPGSRPRPMSAKQHAEVAADCPDEAAALFVFDVWIGNRDREENFIIDRRDRPPRLIGFDHSHALFDADATIDKSLTLLLSDGPSFDAHPFHQLAWSMPVRRSIEMLQSLNHSTIATRCEFGYSVGLVTPELQAALAQALYRRAKALPEVLGIQQWDRSSGSRPRGRGSESRSRR